MSLKRLLILLFVAYCGFVAASVQVSAADASPDSQTLKPRIVVLTDIAPGTVEPDDMESMVRLMAYADQLEIEGLITTTGWNCDPYPTEWADSLHRVIDAYGKDVANLMKRSGQQRFLPLTEEQGSQQIGYWPSVEYLRSRVAMGSQQSGIKMIGPDNDTPGSELIIRLADEDDARPLWIACWGGANTLAQAIWRVKQERTPEQLKAFLQKLRVYSIVDQDMVYTMRFDRAYSSLQWLRRDYASDLLVIWDECACGIQTENGNKGWQLYAGYIQPKGHLGKVYPTYKYGVEGDTPSFLYLIPNGLHDTERPEQAGWGGCYVRDMCPDSVTTAYTNWRAPQSDVSRRYGQHLYPATIHDFMARMAWAAHGAGNRNPVVVMNGSVSVVPLVINATPGSVVKIDCARSYDPDGDAISFQWWTQDECGKNAERITFESRQSEAYVSIPADASDAEFHLICEVSDSRDFPLTSYRRVIVRTTGIRSKTGGTGL